MAKSSAISTPCARAARTMRVEVLERAELRVRPRRGRRSASPIAHGLPGSPGPASSALLRPLRFVAPDRVDRRQVDDVEAELGELRAAPPRRRAKPPHERGKSSYQAPKRASSRSTSSSTRLEVVAAPGPGGARALGRAPRRARRSASVRARRGSSPCARRRRAPRASSPAAAPSASSLGEVLLAAPRPCARARAPGREAIDPRLDLNSRRPSASTANGPPAVAARAVDGAAAPRASGVARRRGLHGRRARTSWPSRKIVALTSTGRRGSRLAGIAAAVDSGRTSWIWIRGAAAGVGCVAGRAFARR